MPACEAVSIHVPAAIGVAVLPATVQMPVVEEAKLTVSPELAVALRLSGAPTVCAAMALNVIVWPCAFTTKLCATAGAAAYVAFPGCEAVIVQVPSATNVALVPDTVHTLAVDEAKLTAKAELVVALKVNGVPTVCAAIAANVIVCDPALTVKLCDSGVAAL